MIRNFLALLVMLLGPLGVWLIYAHFFRGFGTQREFQEAVSIGIAMITGSLGALALGPPVNGWSLSLRLLAFSAYGTVLALAMPMIALIAVCTTGDCL